jgi:uncharacterized RDD family membrane protein YckC
MRLDRLALGPVRAAARSGRGMITSEAERAIDAAFAGPLPEAIGRSLIEHHVVERVAEGMVETAADDGFDPDRLKRLVDRIRNSPGLQEWVAGDEGRQLTTTLTRQLVESAAFKQALKDVLSSPEVRTALTSQAAGFGAEFAEAARRRSRVADERVEGRARRLLHRPPNGQSVGFGGFASRALGLVIDAALAELAFIVLAAAIALVAALAGGLHSGWLAGALAGAGWFIAAAVYFTAFWSTTGQTPGMRLLHVRVTTPAGAPPSAFRSLVRFVGLILAIIPLFAGFLPVLFDSRRRGLQDFLSGTVVLDDDAPRT